MGRKPKRKNITWSNHEGTRTRKCGELTMTIFTRKEEKLAEKLLKAWGRLLRGSSKRASKVSYDEMEFFLWGFDLADFVLPKNADEHDRQVAARIVETIRVYRIIGGLSSEQKKVLEELVENPACSDSDIALRLGMKTKAVSAKMTKLLKKFGCNSRTELVVKFIDHQPLFAEFAAFLLASALDCKATKRAGKIKFAFHSL
jgi:DNA-binding CsgD family transcriptional regulator